MLPNNQELIVSIRLLISHNFLFLHFKLVVGTRQTWLEKVTYDMISYYFQVIPLD